MASSSNDGDFVENYDRDDGVRPSEEDTEDASETEAEKREEEFTGIKEQMYQDQLAQLKRQKQQLRDRTHPLLQRKMKKLDQVYEDMIEQITLRWKDEMDEILEQHDEDVNAAKQEYEEKKIELKESLMIELEHKKKQIESERLSMDLSGDTIGIKPANTRKLRRRPYDPAPIPEKRSKPSPVQIVCEISEDEKVKDLNYINKLFKPKIPPAVNVTQQTLRGTTTRSHV